MYIVWNSISYHEFFMYVHTITQQSFQLSIQNNQIPAPVKISMCFSGNSHKVGDMQESKQEMISSHFELETGVIMQLSATP